MEEKVPRSYRQHPANVQERCRDEGLGAAAAAGGSAPGWPLGAARPPPRVGRGVPRSRVRGTALPPRRPAGAAPVPVAYLAESGPVPPAKGWRLFFFSLGGRVFT